LSYEHLSIERHDGIAVVTFDRAEKYNALSRALMEEIRACADRFLHDVETRVVIFTGAGRHFSAGADLGERRDAEHRPTRLERRRASRLGPRMLRALREIDQITIAAVNGYALGGGCCIATACDLRVAAHDATMGYPEIDLGMNLQWGALPLAVHLLGPARAKRMIGLGRREPAEVLREWGFVDEVVPAAALLERAEALAHEFAAKPPLALQMIKQSVNAVAGALDAAVMHMDHDQWALTADSDDFREVVQAFFERRSPRFKGD